MFPGSKCPFLEGGGEEGGGSVMAEMRRGDKTLISTDQGT